MVQEKKVNIPNGMSLTQISLLLKKENIIRSSDAFRVATFLSGNGGSIKAGMYIFNGKENLIQITTRLIGADYGIPMEKVTIPEGMDSKEISKIFCSKFSSLDIVEFEKKTKSREGYLFPDTYFIPVSATGDDIIDMMSSNFNRAISDVNISSSETSKNLREVLTMASIIEGEAKTNEDKKIVSGILWKRISTGMPLQVDATFIYINNKTSAELTKSDLGIDSPYNTYKYKGFPPSPINNPGIESIKAAMFPTETPYFYYLSDKNGLIHYAKTFEEHKLNKEKYIK